MVYGPVLRKGNVQLTINLSSFKEQLVRLLCTPKMPHIGIRSYMIFQVCFILWNGLSFVALWHSKWAVYLKAIVVWDYYCITFFFSHHRELTKSVGSSDGSLVTALCCGEGHFVHLERLCVADVIKYRKTSSLFIAYLWYPLHKEGSNLSKSESWKLISCWFYFMWFFVFYGWDFWKSRGVKRGGYNQFCPCFSTTWKLVTMQVLPWVNRHSHWDDGKHEKPQNSKLKLLLNIINIPCLDYLGVLTLSCLTFSGFNLAIKRPHSRR